MATTYDLIVIGVGLCSDFMTEPFHRFHAPEQEGVRLALAHLELPGVPLVARAS